MNSPRVLLPEPTIGEEPTLLQVIRDGDSLTAFLWWSWRVEIGLGSDGVAEVRVRRSAVPEGEDVLSVWAPQHLEELGASVRQDGREVWQIQDDARLHVLLGTELAKLYESRYYLFITRVDAVRAAHSLADTIDRMGLSGFVRVTGLLGEQPVREAAGPQI